MNKKSGIVLLLLCCVLGAVAQQEASYGLPVRLSSLEGNLQQSVVTLHWTTVCFLSYAHFQVQQSNDGKNFTTIQTFAADEARCQQPFQVKDTLHTAATVYYRVNVGDADGKYYHSKVISIANRGSVSKLLSVYPTIVQSVATVALNVLADQKTRLQLVSAGGTPIKQYALDLKKGQSFQSLDMSGVAKGVYWLVWTSETGKKQTVPVVKQ